MAQPNVLVLYTGGTLGMRPRGDAPLKPKSALKDLLTWIPELRDFASIDVEIQANIDSALIEPSLWLDLAKRIEVAQRAQSHRGVVIIHGTDTLAYTASALSFLLAGLSLPVVLTGSQKPLAVTRTDARNNVLGAVETALEGPTEVLTFFRERAYRGNRISKQAISNFRAFNSPNLQPMGKAGIDWEWNEDLFWPKTRRPSIWPDVPDHLPGPPLVLPWLPGLDFQALAPALAHQWALIIEGFGSGNVPLTEETRASLKAFMEGGGRVFMRSQVPVGKTSLQMYAPGQAMADMGVVGGLDMTREAMVTKLMVLQGMGVNGDKLSYQMTQSIAGELTED